MSSFEEFLINRDGVDMEVNAGKILVRVNDDTVYKGAYVSGDMEDKLGQTCRAYKKLSEYFLATLKEKDMEALENGDDQ